jgi:hypothetical protein
VLLVDETVLNEDVSFRAGRRKFQYLPRRRWLFGALFIQLAEDFSVEVEWRAGTQFHQPLSANPIRKSPKAEH